MDVEWRNNLFYLLIYLEFGLPSLFISFFLIILILFLKNISSSSIFSIVYLLFISQGFGTRSTNKQGKTYRIWWHFLSSQYDFNFLRLTNYWLMKFLHLFVPFQYSRAYFNRFSCRWVRRSNKCLSVFFVIKSWFQWNDYLVIAVITFLFYGEK